LLSIQGTSFAFLGPLIGAGIAAGGGTAALSMLFGLFPTVGGVRNAMPRPVLGGATIIMFGTVAAAGVKILTTVEIGRRELMILALSCQPMNRFRY